MSFKMTDLSAISCANGFTLWHYRTSDIACVVESPGYFNDGGKMLREGDFIFVNAGIDIAPAHGIVVVTSRDAGTVDVFKIIAFGAVHGEVS